MQIQNILDDFLVQLPFVEQTAKLTIENQMFKDNKLIKSREQNIINSICNNNSIDHENEQHQKNGNAIDKKSDPQTQIQSKKNSFLMNDDFFSIDNQFQEQVNKSQLNKSMVKFESKSNAQEKSSTKSKLIRNQTQLINVKNQYLNHFENVDVSSQENSSKNYTLQNQILERQHIIDILQKQINRRTDDEIKTLVEYFKKFDFSKREKQNQEKREKEAKDKLYQEISLKNKFQIKKASNKSSQIQTPLEKHISPRKKPSFIMDQNEIACDDQSLEQSCRLMKIVMVPKYETVFEYDSFGDIFYMVLQGQVECKIPTQTNLIQLTEFEKNVYQLQFKADLIKINTCSLANQLYKNIQEIQKQKDLFNSHHADYLESLEQQKINNILQDLQKKWNLLNKEMPLIDNPYKVNYRHQLQDYIDSQLLILKEDLIRNRNNSKLKQNNKSQILTKNQSQQTLNNSSVSNTLESNSNDQNNTINIKDQYENKRLIKQQSVLDDITLDDFFNENHEFLRFYSACQTLLDKFEEQKDRSFYEVKLLKRVHIYKEFQSFGELALIQNKPRAAKLIVNGNNDAIFAVLSKKDYKLAQGKLQNEILQQKIKFLRKFIIFKNLSDSALSSLTYIIEEKICSRDQIILKEDIDNSDIIYLVKKGEFKSYKRILIENDQKQNEMNFNSIVKKENSNERAFSSIDIENLKKQDTISKYQNTIEQKYRQIDICIHEQYDMFGYQEFFSDSPKLTISYSVQCLQQNSILFGIHKQYLSNYIRRNPEIYQTLVLKWNNLLEQRLNQTMIQKDLNKIFMDQNDIEIQRKNQQSINSNILKEIENLKQQSIDISPSKQQSIDQQFNQSLLSSPKQKQSQIDENKNIISNIQKSKYQNGIISNEQQQSISSKYQDYNPSLVQSKQEFKQKNSNYQMNYKDFRKSQQGSISQSELKNIKKIEDKIQKLISLNQIKQNIPNFTVNGSIEKQQIILESQSLPKNIRMKQQLYNPLIKKPDIQNSKFKIKNINYKNDLFENSHESNINIPVVKFLQNNENKNEMSLDNSVFSQRSNIGLNQIQLNNFKSKIKIQLIEKRNEDTVYNNDQSKNEESTLQLNQTRDVQKKSSGTQNKQQSTLDSFQVDPNAQEYDFTEWNKELEVIQHKCSKFINLNRAQTSIQTKIDNSSNYNHKSYHEKDILDEIFKIEYIDDNQIDENLNNKDLIVTTQRNLNFENDINNLIKQKQSKLTGSIFNDQYTFQSSDKVDNHEKQNKQFEFNQLKKLRDQQKDSIKQNLINNPIINDAKSQKNLRYFKGYSKNKNHTISKLEQNGDIKRKILKVYSKSNYGSTNVFTANIQNSTQENVNHHTNYGKQTQMQIRSEILKYSKKYDSIESQNQHSQSKKIMGNLPMNQEIQRSTSVFDNLNKYKSVNSKLEKEKNKFSLPKIIMRQVLFDNNDSVQDYFLKQEQNIKLENLKRSMLNEKQNKKKTGKLLEEYAFEEMNILNSQYKKLEKEPVNNNFQTMGLDIQEKLDKQIDSSDLQRDQGQKLQTDRQSIGNQSKSSINSNLLKSIKSNITKSIKDVLAEKFKNDRKISKIISKQQSIYSKDLNDYQDIQNKNDSILNSEKSQIQGEMNANNSFKVQSKIQSSSNTSQKNQILPSNRSSILSHLKKPKSSEKSKENSQSSKKKNKISIEKSFTVHNIKMIKEKASETHSNITSKSKFLKANKQIKNAVSGKKNKQKQQISKDRKSSDLHEIQIDSVSENNQQIQKFRKNMQSIDSDSVLPEYRINARQLTKEELETVQKYHIENYPKFHVDISSDEEFIIKQDTD